MTMSQPLVFSSFFDIIEDVAVDDHIYGFV